MLFSTIYSVDTDGETNIHPFYPPDRRLWDQTEGDSGYEYDYLADHGGDESYRNGHHRKYCAILNREQFHHFISELELVAQDVQTMGSLGAPGFGFGCTPAISFDYEYGSYGDPINCNAYVTPFSPQWTKETAPDWEELRRAIIDVYGDGEEESALDTFDPNQTCPTL